MFVLTSSPLAAMLVAVIVFVGLRAVLALPLAWCASRKGYDWRGFIVAAAFFSWVTTLIVLIVVPRITPNGAKAESVGGAYLHIPASR